MIDCNSRIYNKVNLYSKNEMFPKKNGQQQKKGENKFRYSNNICIISISINYIHCTSIKITYNDWHSKFSRFNSTDHISEVHSMPSQSGIQIFAKRKKKHKSSKVKITSKALYSRQLKFKEKFQMSLVIIE